MDLSSRAGKRLGPGAGALTSTSRGARPHRRPRATMVIGLAVVLAAGLLAGSLLAVWQRGSGSASFGRLPAPHLARPDDSLSQLGTGDPILYLGPARLSVSAPSIAAPAKLPVYRFSVPDLEHAANQAGAYGGKPIVPAPQLYREPLVQVTLSGPGTGTGTAPADSTALAAAAAALAGKGLTPGWRSRIEVVDQPPLAFVRYIRQFQAGGYGQAAQVDAFGAFTGADVAVRGDGRAFQMTVPLPLSLESEAYPARPAAKAARDAVTLPPPVAAGLGPPPQVDLSHLDLVYIAVSAGSHGYFEPAYLFTGTFSVGTTTYEKRVLVPALDASDLR